MADILAALIILAVLFFFDDILIGIGAIVAFVFSRIAEVIDILIEKLRGTGG